MDGKTNTKNLFISRVENENEITPEDIKILELYRSNLILEINIKREAEKETFQQYKDKKTKLFCEIQATQRWLKIRTK